MAVTLPYEDMEFVPLDILTAQEQNQLVANIEYLAGVASTQETAIAAAANITMTTTDPGEGEPLAANHFIAVYEA